MPRGLTWATGRTMFWDRNKGTPGDLSTRKPSISRSLIPEQKKLLTASRGVITNGSPKRLNEVWTSMESGQCYQAAKLMTSHVLGVRERILEEMPAARQAAETILARSEVQNGIPAPFGARVPSEKVAGASRQVEPFKVYSLNSDSKSNLAIRCLGSFARALVVVARWAKPYKAVFL